jgi:hypothetical protein
MYLHKQPVFHADGDKIIYILMICFQNVLEENENMLLENIRKS